MAKKRTSFALDGVVILLLKKLAEKNNRSLANQLEELVRAAAKDSKIQ